MALSGDVLLQVAFKPAISLAAVALTIYSLTILLRDGLLRAHYSIGVAAGLYAILLSMTPEVSHVESRICGVIGLGLCALGLLDHRLLAGSICQPRGVEHTSLAPPVPLVRMRIVAAAACLAVLGAYIAGFGWPGSALGITLAMYIFVGLIAFVISLLELPVDFRDRPRAYSELTRAREQQLLAVVRREEHPLEASHSTVPLSLDVLGHLIIPLLIGCGAIVDVTAGIAGMPSMLALSLAASHFWIAVRDWPRRTHYLLGSAVAAISAVHYIFLGPAQQLEWFVWFLLLPAVRWWSRASSICASIARIHRDQARHLMSTPFEHLAALNRLVHEPSRLAILTALSACDKADFTFLLNITGLTKGNLSSHLTKLEQANLVAIEKTYDGRQPITYAMLTLEGREALKEHWDRLESIRKGARPLKTLKVT
jgi:DNA-binding MarR family transcriptional regulator